ncbi:MAG: ectoine hydrolase [Thermoproteota archaeon]|nr:ectoine hydrolase [Thermoproteota archaeon]
MGSEFGQCGVGCAPARTLARAQPSSLLNHELKYGQVFFLIEFNGAEGFYGEISRTACLGVAPKPLLDLWRDAVEAQDRTAEIMKDGADPREL